MSNVEFSWVCLRFVSYSFPRAESFNLKRAENRSSIEGFAGQSARRELQAIAIGALSEARVHKDVVTRFVRRSTHAPIVDLYIYMRII